MAAAPIAKLPVKMAAASTKRVLRTGSKQVFLPDHMITFLRPKANSTGPPPSPQFATFKVPLTFNKLDLRDYLLHAYAVATLGVRSQLRQQRPRRSRVHGRIYRPPPVKTMTVELAAPFVWPARPEDRTPWASEREERRDASLRRQRAIQARIQKTGAMPLRDELGAPPGRASLREEARRLLREGGWSNERVLDPKFTEGKAAKGKGKEKTKEKKKKKKRDEEKQRESDVD